MLLTMPLGSLALFMQYPQTLLHSSSTLLHSSLSLLFYLMEHLWAIPEQNEVKINVYCVVVQQPSAYGNTKSIGALMRDEYGGKVWGAMGPFNNFTEEQALMAGIQSACIYAQKHDLQVTHIETSHLDVFELIRL